MSQSKKILLLTLASLAFSAYCASYVPVGFLGDDDTLSSAQASTLPQQSAHEQLLAVQGIPANRLEAWDIYVHSIISELFGCECYSEELRMLVSSASWMIEKRTQSTFESDLHENQQRVLEQLAPMLLAKNGDLPEQAKILMWMVSMHPEKQSDDVLES